MNKNNQLKSNFEAYKSAIEQCKQLDTDLKRRISKKSFTEATFSTNGAEKIRDHYER